VCRGTPSPRPTTTDNGGGNSHFILAEESILCIVKGA